MCAKLSTLGWGWGWEEDWGTECGGSSGDWPGPGDRQVVSGAVQSRERISAAGSRQAQFHGQVQTSWLGDLGARLEQRKVAGGGVGSAFWEVHRFLPDTTALFQPS